MGTPRTIVVDQQLAAAERTSAQQIPVHLASAVNGLSSWQAQQSPSSAPVRSLGPSTAAILTEIFQTASQAIATSASSTATEKTKEAAEKAKVWSIVAAIAMVVVAIVVAVIAIIGSVFSGGVSLALIAIVAAIISVATAAVQKAHPLAGQLGAALFQASKAFDNFARGNRYDTVATDAALRAILQSLHTIEGLGRESERMTVPCTGDPDAIYQCGQQMGPLLSRLADILQTMRLLADDQRQSAIRVLLAGRTALSRPRPPK
jgi:hypothetical protein